VLYGQFVEIWLSEAEQRGLNEQLGERLAAPADLYVARLAHLALRLTEQPQQANLETLAGFVAEQLQNQEGFTRLHAETYGRQFVRVMAQRSGVFTRRGDAFDFIHPTFREYLAACAVVRESKHDRGYDLEHAWARAVSRWADNNWREVALFALSLLSDKGQDITALVSRVWQEKEGLYFAGAALAEQVKVDENLSDGIINGLFTSAREDVLGWLRSPNAISILGELRSYPRAGDRLLALARDEKVNEWVRESAAEALGQLGRANEATPILLALARDWKVDEEVRVRAAAALGKLGRADDLLALARDEKMEAWVRVNAAEVLGYFGRADEAAQAWLALARDEKVYEWVHISAVAVLGKLGWADDLVALACDEKVNERVRVRAAAALDELGRANEAAQAWLALAGDGKVDVDVRVHAVAALGKLGRADDLLALAGDEKMYLGVRERAAAALGEFGRADEAAQAWLAVAGDEKVDVDVRVDAAAALGQFAGTRVLPTLEWVAQEDKNKRVRRAAQRAIEQIRQRIG